MGTTARPRHHSITVIVLLQLDDPLTWPDASAGYFLGSFSLRSDWAARSLTKLRSVMSQIRPGQHRHSLSRLKMAVRLAPSVEPYAGRAAPIRSSLTSLPDEQETGFSRPEQAVATDLDALAPADPALLLTLERRGLLDVAE
jgi:hypothetical protein